MTEFQKVYHSAKRPIDIWTNYLYYTFSIRLVYFIRNTRISPNGLTLTALVLALIGCAGFAQGTRSFVLIGLVFAQVSYIFDCADGQLARYRKQYSIIGGWLDQVADRVKEFAVYFSLAFGYARTHTGQWHIWMWAMGALFTLYLLEYYGQIEMYRPQGKAAAMPEEAATSVGNEEQDTFSKLQKWRSFIPFRGFIIGEQYFAMLVFVLFNAIYPFFIFVTLLGALMSVYRPIIQFIKLRRALAANQTAIH